MQQVDARFSAIDLFSGCGGLTTGLKSAGFDVIAAIEIHDLSVEMYKLNHPEVTVFHENIRTLSAELVLTSLDLLPGELDLLAGCPPCQGFSTLRTKLRARSVDDHRNDLTSEFLRFVRVLQPKTVMMENVPNLALDPTRIVPILNELKNLGYAVDAHSVRVLNAADFGVAQRRHRMILMASKHGALKFAMPVSERKTVFDALSSIRVGKELDPSHNYPVKRSDRVTRLIASVPKDGGSRSSVPPELQLDCHRRTNGFHDVYGRMSWKDVAPTITSGCFNPSKGRFLHPEENRAITIREASLLQSFPASYKIPMTRGRQAAAALIGNAFPPEFARQHAQMIATHLDELGVKGNDGWKRR